MENIKTTIKNFFSNFIGDVILEDDDDYFETGIVNSLFAMQLVLFVEKTFGVELDGDDLDISNMNTLNAITGLVNKKLEKVS